MVVVKSFTELLRKGNHELVGINDSYSIYKDYLGNYFFGLNSIYKNQLCNNNKWTFVTSFENYLKMREVELSVLKDKLFLRPINGCSFRYEKDSILLNFDDSTPELFFESVCEYFQRMLLCVVEIRKTDTEIVARYLLGFPVIGLFLSITEGYVDLEKIHEFALAEEIEIIEGEDEKFLYASHPFIKNKLKWSDLRFIYHDGVVFFFQSDSFHGNLTGRIKKSTKPNLGSRIWDHAIFAPKDFDKWKEQVKIRKAIIDSEKQKNEQQIRRIKNYSSGSKESGCPRCFEDPCMCSDYDPN